MAVTGHKSSSSLETYQHVHSEEKMKMGHTLGLTLIQKPNQLMLTSSASNTTPLLLPQPSTSAVEVPAVEYPTINIQDLKENITPETAVISFDHGLGRENTDFEDPLAIPNNEIVSYVEEVEASNEDFLMSQTTSKKFKKNDGTAAVYQEQMVTKKSSPKIPLLFHGCKIDGNITINLHK